MKIRVKLKPGQKGTKRLLEQYGDALICVRYRYDAKTVSDDFWVIRRGEG